MDRLKIFQTEINFIETEEVRKFLEAAIEMLPDYFFTVPASSSGKYHPQYALGEGGLVRHTRAACKFCMYLLNLEQTKQAFTTKERDLILSSVLLHDGWKHGNGGNKNTVFEHPLVAADWIKNNERFLLYLHKEDLNFVGDCIASHMGEWNTNKRSTFVLEKPMTESQKLVHICDYLASRKDIEVLFGDESVAPTIKREANLRDFVIPFGKHKGDTLELIYEIDQSYFNWALNNFSDGKIKENMIKFAKEKESENKQ